MNGSGAGAGKTRWWARLFGARDPGSSDLGGAVAKLIDGIDPRLRLVRGCTRRLTPVLEGVLGYFQELTARIPPAVEFSERRWAEDPLLRFLFADIGQLKHVFSASGELRGFFRAHPGAAEAFVGMGLTRHENRAPGMALAGETVRRDVMQTSIGFTERLVVGASGDEAELRAKLKARCLDFLIAEVLGQLARQFPAEAETEDGLKLWLRAREHERCAVEGLFCSTDGLDREIAVLRDRLAQRGRFALVPRSSVVTLEERLERTCAALESVPRTITLDIVRVRVDHSNVVLPADAAEGMEVAFAEAAIGSLPPRTIVLARVPRDQLLPEEELFATAQRFLG